MSTDLEMEEVRQALHRAQLGDAEVDSQALGDERIFVISVNRSDRERAVALAGQIEDAFILNGKSVLVTVRTRRDAAPAPEGPLTGIQDPRVSRLIQLLTSRSRTSEAQPSLSYIPNNTANLAAVTGTRHHLVFGRRGAGKTALLLEAKRLVESEGHVTVWVNVQPLRDQGIERAFLLVQEKVIDTLISEARARGRSDAKLAKNLERLHASIDVALDGEADPVAVRRMVPSLQQAIQYATFGLGLRLYVFLDDFYFIPRAEQADVLDLLHGATRDSDVWLKVASVRHLTRWFRPSPPTGLQTGQDADLVDLDLSLQDPGGTIRFMRDMFTRYCAAVGIDNLNSLFNRESFERLVFASGGVPRDFLTLAASATTKARARSGSRAVGIIEVNQAAGDAAQSKLGELEDDLASNAGFAPQAYRALNEVRDFCLDDRGFTYFRVDFRDRDRNPDLYAVLTRLLEVRLLHLIDGSVSDKERAGERSECYTLDLSQYSGSRLKQKLRVLDLNGGRLVSKQTRVKGPVYEGNTAREVLGILRSAPQFPLSRFDGLLAFEPIVESIRLLLGARSSATIDELVLESGASSSEVESRLSELVQQRRVGMREVDGVHAYHWLG
ncbi:hypothetical protein [Cellulosimicrobium sp. SL-1]|uniref:hypothetical protein n=1 Tax=Cellulosimicrobium sp. SL-1 TaxID=2699423 RepID=UPI0013D89BEB|nr:hypothetical protein [Cellulosimicrobium sp. SL-1]